MQRETSMTSQEKRELSFQKKMKKISDYQSAIKTMKEN